MSPSHDVCYGVADWVATVTLDRPEVLNAVRRRTLRELREAIEASAADPNVRVLVLTGNGRGFCAGQDLDELAEQLNADEIHGADHAREVGLQLLEEFQDLTRLLLNHPRPTIAALNGVAVGVGAELAIACDIRIASQTARIGFVEAARGLFQTNGVTWLLPRIIGMSRALELLVTAEVVDATEAERLGLINRVVSAEAFAREVRTLTGRIAANAPLSVSQLVSVVRSAYDHDLDTAMSLEVAATLRCMASDDLREGTTAFHEGRPPVFHGK